MLSRVKSSIKCEIHLVLQTNDARFVISQCLWMSCDCQNSNSHWIVWITQFACHG